MKLCCLTLVACLGAATGAHAQVNHNDRIQYAEIPGSMEFSGRIIAKPLQDDAARGRIQNAELFRQAVAQTLQAYELYWYEELVDHYVLELPQGETENDAARKLMATGLFEFVEPDWTLYPVECPDDSAFNNQWHHTDTKMRSCVAWDIHTGTPAVTVGICDTGIETNHPDLLLNRKEGYNAVNRLWENQGGQIGPVHSHGTQTTGCAAANGNNGTGVAGVGWNLSHRMMRVSNSSGGSSNSSTLTHAALTSIQAGDRVANVSYSGVNTGSVRSTATQIKALGGLLTWSAGNDGANLNWGDRDADDVIVVGASTVSDRKANFSAFGRSVDLFAPGASVYTTNTGSSYGSVSGTSFSAPLTAGLIGLIWSYDPSLTPDEVEAILKGGCDDLGSAGIDDTFGYGRINSYNSLLLVDGGGPTFPFLEDWDDTEVNDNVWVINSGGVVSPDADDEPSAPYSLNLDGTDMIESTGFDISGVVEAPILAFYTQHKGVESGESLLVEYRDFFGDWIPFETIASDGQDQTEFQRHAYEIPLLAWSENFAIRFTAQGSTGDDDWYIDDITIAPFEGNVIPFLEAFETTTPSDLVWDTVSGAVVNDAASNEPSEPYSFNFDSTDSATTQDFLLAGAPFPTYVSFFVQHKGVENGKTLTVEYFNHDSVWTNLVTLTSDGADQSSFAFFQDDLTFDAYHDEFRLRFTAAGSDGTDDWYVDDIRIGDEFTPPDDCIADFNGDGSVNTQDVLAFLNAYSDGDASADINGDGSVNTQDVIAFLNFWSDGCP